MLPSLGLNEILVLGVLALVVIGPKDLPLLLRKLGRWTAKLRGMAQEFRTGFDELARQAELDELKKEVEALRRTTNLNSLANEITSPAAKALPTLEDYAGLNEPAPVAEAPLPLDGGGVVSEASDGGGARADPKEEASEEPLGNTSGPHPLSHPRIKSGSDSSPVEGEREAEPLVRSAP